MASGYRKYPLDLLRNIRNRVLWKRAITVEVPEGYEIGNFKSGLYYHFRSFGDSVTIAKIGEEELYIRMEN